MRRSTHIETVPRFDARPAHINPYPRLLMICGVALIGYGLIAPAVILFRTAASALHTTRVPPVGNTATAKHDLIKEIKSKEMQSSRTGGTGGGATQIAATYDVTMNSRAEIIKLYAQWKDAWTNRDVEGILRLYSPRAQFRLNSVAPWQGYTGMEGSLGRLITAGYTIIDRDTPNLSIEGDRAILAVEQSYSRTPQSPYGLSYSHRFVLEHDVESNNRLPGSARQWRIVKSEFGTSQVLKENGGEIY